jgi:diguanylate cyclase (GGDEF)-like protein
VSDLFEKGSAAVRFKSLARRFDPNELPIDIYRQLVGDLYGPIQSALIGALTTTLVGCFISSRTHSAELAALTAAMALVAVGRLLLALTFRKKGGAAGDVRELRRWERLYFTGASAYTACLGSLCLVALVFTDDAISHLLILSLAIGYTAAATQRNSSRPLVALTQLLFVISPIILGSVLRLEPAYGVLSLITLLYLLAMVEIATYHAEARLSLLATARELALSNIHLDSAISNMSHGLCMFDKQQRLILWNKPFCEMHNLSWATLKQGSTVEELIDLSVNAGNHPGRTVAEITADLESNLARGGSVRSKRKLPNGRTIAVSLRSMADGGTVGIFEDVTEYEEATARVQHLSTHDDLTGLPNRMSFRQALNEAVLLGQRYGNEFSVLFIDLDRFKIINDTLGHGAGDELLKQVSARLKACLRASDTIARLGGDEFIVLLREISDRADVAAVAQMLLSAAITPMIIQGQECQVTGSIGISMFPADAADDETLIKHADSAMYAAKEQGRNQFCFHSSEMSTQSLERLALESSLLMRNTSAQFKDQANKPDHGKSGKRRETGT